MTSITKLGDAGIFWIVLTLLFLIIPKMRKTGIIMAAALIMDLLICNVAVKNLAARTRPYDVNTSVQLLVAKLHDYSFPSGHTAAAFASSMAILRSEHKKLGACALIYATLMGFSRLYVGIHYPTDVIAGMILGDLFGLAGAAIAALIYRKLKEKKKISGTLKDQ